MTTKTTTERSGDGEANERKNLEYSDFKISCYSFLCFAIYSRVRDRLQKEGLCFPESRELSSGFPIPISRWYEIKYHVIGKFIGYSCYLIGRFMPYFFAGKLESGNVREYFVMMRTFHSLGIAEHDEVLYEMGIKEKEHEVHFLNAIRNERWLPVFERVFSWGLDASANDVDLEAKRPASRSDQYCANYIPDRTEDSDT